MSRRVKRIHSKLLTRGTFANNDKRRPVGRVRIAPFARDHFCHGAALGLRPSDCGIALSLLECAGNEFDGCMTVDVPVRYQQSPCARPENAPPPMVLAAAVLQAERITKSALSFSVVTSDAVSNPSSCDVAVAGGVNMSEGSARALAMVAVS